MRKLMVAAVAVAALGAAGSSAQANESSPCAPQARMKRCEQLSMCESAGAAVFEDSRVDKAARVRYYRDCIWIERRYVLLVFKNAGYLLHHRVHRIKRTDTTSYPLWRRAVCENQGKSSYC